MTQPFLSVVVPAYNEEKNILETIRRIEAFMVLKGWEWEILVSSDGSTDQTDALVQEAIHMRADSRVKLLRSDQNHGKGFTVRRDVLTSEGRMILVTDVDLSTPVKEVDKLLSALDAGFDVAIGSRALRSPGCDVQQSAKRWLAGRIFNALVRVLVLRGFEDTQCGFKLFKREAAQIIFSCQKINGFSFDVEVLWLAEKLGLRVKEVPVMWRQAVSSKVRLVRDSFGMIRELISLRFRKNG